MSKDPVFRADGDVHVWQVDLRSLAEFRDWAARDAEILAFRRSLQHRLESELLQGSDGVYLGYCVACGCHRHFKYDWLYSDRKSVNWRERLVCLGCGLNNRLRLSFQAAVSSADLSSADVYLTEHLTPLADALRSKCSNLVCSEYLGEKFSSGKTDGRGVRHEDMTRLSFKSNSFDLVLSFDVLEHIPDYRAALVETFRVLRSGGRFVFSVPLHLGSGENIVRARVDGKGKVTHLLPPEYHGDPVDPERGILCYYHFGWELCSDLREAGFGDASFRLHWSSDCACIGDEQVLVFARK